MYFEIIYDSPTNASAGLMLQGIRPQGANVKGYPYGVRTKHQYAYLGHVRSYFESHPLPSNMSATLVLSQTWDELPTESTAYWHLLDQEPYVNWSTPKLVLPFVTELRLQELHPKFVSMFLRVFDLPHLTKLDLDYDTDLTDSRPDRRELLRVLTTNAPLLLSRLTHFRLSFEVHCHDRETIAQLCSALPNVTYFSLHYWGGVLECEEWWDVLKLQWGHVAAWQQHLQQLQASGAAVLPFTPLLPLLPRLRRLHVSGFDVPGLREVLGLRARIGYPVREVEYQMGCILQSEHDALVQELDVFHCFEHITPDLQRQA